MNDNEKNLHQDADETEGHSARFNGAVPEETDEGTEGHAFKPKGAQPEDNEDGTEGHGVRIKI